MEADGEETGKRKGRPDRRNQLDLSADMMWSLRQGSRAVTLSEEQNRGPESQPALGTSWGKLPINTYTLLGVVPASDLAEVSLGYMARPQEASNDKLPMKPKQFYEHGIWLENFQHDSKAILPTPWRT